MSVVLHCWRAHNAIIAFNVVLHLDRQFSQLKTVWPDAGGHDVKGQTYMYLILHTAQCTHNCQDLLHFVKAREKKWLRDLLENCLRKSLLIDY